jgi:hypothetical protein
MISVYLFCRLSPLNASYNGGTRLSRRTKIPFAAMELDHIRIANKKSLEKFVEDYFPPR